MANQNPTLTQTGALALEVRLVEEINGGDKIKNTPVSKVEEALRWCMMKVGIRENNLPCKEEAYLLYDHLTRFYGGHTIGELKLAFEMAISGQLDIDESDANPFGSFDCRYLSCIMNSFERWATEVYSQHRVQIEGSANPPLVQHGTSFDWRGNIQELLNDFLKDEKKINFELLSSDFYEQLVVDEFLLFGTYKFFVDLAKTKLCSETQKEIMMLEYQMRSDQRLHKARYRCHEDLERKLSQYRSGVRDHEVFLLAKQMALHYYFKYLRDKNITTLYEMSD